MGFYAHSEHAANQDTIREFVGRGVGTELFGSSRSTCTLSVRVVVVSDLTHVEALLHCLVASDVASGKDSLKPDGALEQKSLPD